MNYMNIIEDDQNRKLFENFLRKIFSNEFSDRGGYKQFAYKRGFSYTDTNIDDYYNLPAGFYKGISAAFVEIVARTNNKNLERCYLEFEDIAAKKEHSCNEKKKQIMEIVREAYAIISDETEI